MNCRQAQRILPGYLDGAIPSRQHSLVRAHLESCADCRQDLERFHQLSVCLANIQPVAAPADLALRIRLQASQARSFGANVRHLWSRAKLVFENILEPLAVPATGGIVTALVVFVLLVQNILVGVPVGFVPNDLPLKLVQPAQLESLAPFAVPGIVATDGQPDSGALLLEVTLNAQGEVVSYRILSGPSNAAVQRQLDQVLLFSRFRPRLDFGRPMDGGRVILGFSEVRVRG
ncbi:MAG TPA: anti-sigma factor [Candidatus Acidoferrum sp.]|nr:anti-sigma factor [Candidatus Acidoferrum sp.]